MVLTAGDRQGAAFRISLLNAAMGVVMVLLGVAAGTVPITAVPWEFFVLLVIIGLAVELSYRLVSGLPRAETSELRRQLRGRWSLVIYLAVFIPLAALLAPGVPKGIVPFLPHLSFASAVGLAAGTAMLVPALMYLAGRKAEDIAR